jgi:DNA helicase HerA-like ATPase
MTGLNNFYNPDGNKLTNSAKGHELVLTPGEVAALWHLPTEGILAPGVVRSTGAKAPLPVELIQQKNGMLLGTNIYQGRQRQVYLADPDRITHMNIVGKTRVGKTTFMHNLIHQDIAAGKGVGVVDPHGDLVQNILESSIPSEREKDVILFDLTQVATMEGVAGIEKSIGNPVR